MDFKNSKGIYLQIADAICEDILSEKYKPDDKLLSVREMAATIGVNPNTVMRTYSELQNNKIIANQRGIGFFVDKKAKERIRKLRKKEFFKEELPEFFKRVTLLNLTKEEVSSIIENLKTIEYENQ